MNTKTLGPLRLVETGLIDTSDNDTLIPFTDCIQIGIRSVLIQLAKEQGHDMFYRKDVSGKWIRGNFDDTVPESKSDDTKSVVTAIPENDVIKRLANSNSMMPSDIIVSDIKWKFLLRNIMRGKNIMMTGPAGTGKTQTAIAAAKAINSTLAYFNLGATQDPKSYLLGNTHLDAAGTVFKKSAFIQAITTPNTVVLLDELTRSNPEAWNILMSVLDYKLRCVRLDDDPNSPQIKVADNVSFIATANIGNEYTSTRVLDRAIMDRFVTFEMEPLNDAKERSLAKIMFPILKENVFKQPLDIITKIANETRKAIKLSDCKISTAISTRVVLEMAELLIDGFSIDDILECVVYPMYSEDGGTNSERTYIKTLIQKHYGQARTSTLTD